MTAPLHSHGYTMPGDKLRVLSLFAGIGGFDLGLERTGGFSTVAFCEIEEFPRRVLAKHWPHVPCYHDVRELTGAILAADGIAVDVIVGGFPCQDVSAAGKLAGIADGTRSGLWSEIVRLVCEIRPQFVIVENVANLLAGPSEKRGGWFGRVLGDLAECGYDAEWENIPAAAVGAPHPRERVWIVAYPTQVDARHCLEASRISQQLRGIFRRDWIEGENQPQVLRVDDGLPAPMDAFAALGNAVVPQIPELIGNAILNSLSRIPARKPGVAKSPQSGTGQHFTGTPSVVDRDAGHCGGALPIEATAAVLIPSFHGAE